MFPPTAGRSECSHALSKISYFYELENPQDILRLEPCFLFCGAPGQSSLKKNTTPILSQESRDEWESCVCNLFCINIYVGVYVMDSGHFNRKIVPCPVYIFGFLLLLIQTKSPKAVCMLLYTQAHSLIHTHCVTSPTVLICVADCAGVEAYVQ